MLPPVVFLRGRWHAEDDQLPRFSGLRPALPAALLPFDYDTALAECAKGHRAALHRIYQHESRRLLGRSAASEATARALRMLHDAFMNIWTRAGRF